MASNVVIPVKSEADRREYRILTLPNELQVTLCSDPEATMAAAAMDVGVGSFSDPIEAPGLAHFLEHMLFLGTEKYPDENSYSATLAKFGGYSNAWTSMENTNFYFEVNANNLDEMLDRFAQFFIAPLFTETATDREMNAVHSEHQKNLQNDSWRDFQLLKALVNPDHPMGRFATGDLTTLRDLPKQHGINVRDLLIAFHAKHYSSSLMKLAVVGKESLDQLEKWVVDRFSPVKRIATATPPVFSEDVIRSPHDTAALIRYAPVKDLRALSLTWQMPSTNAVYATRPAGFISHLLGHEGEGSLFSKLKRMGLATSLTAGPSHTATCFAMFYVTIRLTEAGMSKTDQIAEMVYAYLSLLSQASDSELKAQFDEWAAISSFAFRFKSKESVSGYASQLANSMHTYAPADLLAGPNVPTVFDVALIRKYLACCTPRRAVTTFAAKALASAVKFDKTEKWYGTQYAATPIPEAVYLKYESPSAEACAEMHLPRPNAFIPTDFDIRTESSLALAPPAASATFSGADNTSALDAVLFAALMNQRVAQCYRYCCGRDAAAHGSPVTADDFSHAASTLVPAADCADRFKWSQVPPQRVEVPVPVKTMFDVLAEQRAASAANNASGAASPAAGAEAEAEDDEDAEAEAGAEGDSADAEAEAAPASPVAAPLSDEDKAPERVDSVVVPVELWHKLDRVFSLPKAIACLQLYLPEAHSSAAASVMTVLYTSLVEDSLNEVVYDADVAQLSFNFSSMSQAHPVMLSFRGYSHKLPAFIDTVLQRLKTLVVDPTRFVVIKEQIARSYANRSKAAAYESARSMGGYVTHTKQTHLLLQMMYK